MSSRGDKEFLADISEAINRIARYTGGLTLEKFSRDDMARDAVARNLEVIGEAVKNLSKDLTGRHQEVDWSKIAGLRDRLIHFYFGVNVDLVWDVVSNKLPELKIKTDQILQELS